MEKLIGTHNSVTGESSRRFIDKLLVPFAKCQSKTIVEQMKYGVTFFDIRIKLDENNKWRCCHGLWQSKKTLDDVLSIINQFSQAGNRKYVSVTCECIKDNIKFMKMYPELEKRFKNIFFVEMSLKKPKWFVLKTIREIKIKMDFAHIDFKHWNIIIPIPYVWKKKYKIEDFDVASKGFARNKDVYKVVDFI